MVWVVVTIAVVVEKGMLKGSKDTVEPEEASTAELLKTHTEGYLQSLKVSTRRV